MGRFFEDGKRFPRLVADIRPLVGKKIEFVLERDIDRSGRGFYWTKFGTVVREQGKNIWLDNGDVYFWREINEYRIIE